MEKELRKEWKETIKPVIWPLKWPILLVLASFGLLGFGLAPSINTVMTIQQQNTEIRTEVAKLSAKESLLKRMDEAAVRSQLATAVSAIPDDKAATGILTGLERLAISASSSVSTFSISPGKLSTPSANATPSAKNLPNLSEKPLPKNLYRLTFELGLRGDLNGLESYLAQLSGVNRLVNVAGINYKTGGVTSGAGLTQLVLYVYYQPVLSDLGPIDSPLSELTAKQQTLLNKVAEFSEVTQEPPLLPAGKTNPFGQ